MCILIVLLETIFFADIQENCASYWQVYEARDRRGGTLCAVKMSKREFYSREDRDRYMREIQSVACLAEHPNVVNYFRGWQQDSHFYIQMELCEAGNLRMFLDSLKKPLDEHQVGFAA